MTITNHFLQRMLQIDPNYGSQQHQRTYLKLWDDLQSDHPCTADHEHEQACYPADVFARVRDANRPPTLHARPLPEVIHVSDPDPSVPAIDLGGPALW